MNRISTTMILHGNNMQQKIGELTSVIGLHLSVLSDNVMDWAKNYSYIIVRGVLSISLIH